MFQQNLFIHVVRIYKVMLFDQLVKDENGRNKFPLTWSRMRRNFRILSIYRCDIRPLVEII